jgi:Lon protease-like protein
MPRLELPIFPLGIVLFPGTPQLLHIFEPRYRQLLADSLGGNRRFGISFVETGADKDAAPKAGDVGCCALIRESRLLPDGRSNILTVGEDRYVLLEYVATDLPYRVGRVETFEDEDLDAPQLEELGTETRGHFARFVAGMQTLSDRPQETLHLEVAPTSLSFQIAAALELDASVKQELLALRSTQARLRRLLRILGPLNDELDQRVLVHTRAKGNGRGGVTRDVVTGEG